MSEETKRDKALNPMLRPRIRKVTVNISVGKSGEPLENAMKVLQQLADQKPVKRKAKKTIRDFGIRKGEPTACIVTLRKERATEFLVKALQAFDNKISKNAFDRNGNFSFGIKEHIEIPGTRYLPELGIFGMDVSLTVGRAGYRVKERKRAKSRIGAHDMMTPEEAMIFVKDAIAIDIV